LKYPSISFLLADMMVCQILANALTQLNGLLKAEGFEWDVNRRIKTRYQSKCITSVLMDVEDKNWAIQW